MLAEIVAEKVVHNVTPMWRIVDLKNFKKQEECPRIYFAAPPYMVLSQDGETVTMKIPAKDGGSPWKRTMSIGELFHKKEFEEFIKYSKICGERLATIRRREKELEQNWAGRKTIKI